MQFGPLYHRNYEFRAALFETVHNQPFSSAAAICSQQKPELIH
jgi:hypothetical protein